MLTALTVPNVRANNAAGGGGGGVRYFSGARGRLRCLGRGHKKSLRPASLATLTTEPRLPNNKKQGDWRGVGALLSGAAGLGGHYDVVLAAEAIYSPDAQERLLGCIKQVLRPPHGVALLAAKSYYFGVGGSMAGFMRLVADDGVLEAERLAVIEDGASNKRELLRLSFPAAIAPFFL